MYIFVINNFEVWFSVNSTELPWLLLTLYDASELLFMFRFDFYGEEDYCKYLRIWSSFLKLEQVRVY